MKNISKKKEADGFTESWLPALSQHSKLKRYPKSKQINYKRKNYRIINSEYKQIWDAPFTHMEFPTLVGPEFEHKNGQGEIVRSVATACRDPAENDLYFVATGGSAGTMISIMKIVDEELWVTQILPEHDNVQCSRIFQRID